MSGGIMTDKMDLQQCRLCTKSKDVLIGLFSGELSGRNLVKVIRERLQVSITDTDALPKMICVECKKTIEEFEAFRQSCLLADKIFKTSLQTHSSILSESNIEIPEDPKFLSLPICVEPVPQQIQNLKVEVSETDPESNNTYQELSCQDLETHTNAAVVKDPHQDDYILVKEESFTLGDRNNRVPNNFVEFSRPGIKPSDRVLIDNVRKREVLPQMWDVYEKQVSHNITNVIMRRYIISKSAFPCSLCNKCVAVQCNMHTNDDSFGKNFGMRNTSALTFESETMETQPFSYNIGYDTGEMLECEYCKKPFPRLTSLKRHLRTHFGYETLPCETCGKGFSRKEHLVRHMLLHTGGRPFECEVCKKTFTRKEHLNRHMLIHTGDLAPKTPPACYSSKLDCVKDGIGGEVSAEKPIKRHTCEICGNGFGRKEHMVRHVRRTHSLSYPDYVPLANFTATSMGEDFSPSLSTSSETVPNYLTQSVEGSPLSIEERNTYLCGLCPRSFSREAHLIRHLRIHARDSMFVNDSKVPGTDITFSLINAID